MPQPRRLSNCGVLLIETTIDAHGIRNKLEWKCPKNWIKNRQKNPETKTFTFSLPQPQATRLSNCGSTFLPIVEQIFELKMDFSPGKFAHLWKEQQSVGYVSVSAGIECKINQSLLQQLVFSTRIGPKGKRELVKFLLNFLAGPKTVRFENGEYNVENG